MCSVWTWQGVHWTKQHLNRCCPSLQMYLKKRVSPLQLVYNIGLISLIMLSSLPTTVAIVCPSLSWMSLKSRLIACWRKVYCPIHFPLWAPCVVCPQKKWQFMIMCGFQVTECQHKVGKTPLTTYR